MTDDIYVSHKKVKRIPMTRMEYNVYRGWELPENENGADEGYLVEYLDGGKPNHPKHQGYISWSPKEQFDKGYTLESEAITVKERAQEEWGELHARKLACTKFIATVQFNELPDEARLLLVRQNEVMLNYLSILEQRIALMEG